MTSTYGIRDDYVPNSALLTLDSVSGSNYWNADRIGKARLYQFGVYALVSRLVRRHGVQCVIDVGCGAGGKLPMLHERHPELALVGIDQPHAVEFCRSAYPFAKFYDDDFERPRKDMHDVRREVVLAADVIEHLGNPDHLLDYIRRRLAPGGRIVLSTPERERLRGADCRACPNPHHMREWSQDEFAAYLRSRNFEIESHTLQLPVRATASKLFYREVLRRGIQLQPVRTNQVCVLRDAAEQA